MSSLNQSELNCVLKLKNFLIGGEVVDLRIGYSTTLQIINAKEPFSIGIGNSEVIIDGKSHWLDVYDVHSKVILAHVFKSTITSFDIDKNGNLSIGFDNNSKKIFTKFGLDYEAWEINGPKGFQVVCTPGGQLVFWDGKER